MLQIHPVVLSGGTGQRLWPLSTGTFPKQYQPLFDEESLFLGTLNRLKESGPGRRVSKPVVIGSQDHAAILESILENAGQDTGDVVFEPVGRNTAPAAAIAALHISNMDPDAVVLLLPSDHFVKDEAAFWTWIDVAKEAATRNDAIVTLGITPTYAATGYGYIRCGKRISSGSYEISTFTEKPETGIARGYLESGHYFWNAGIFVFRPSVLLNEFARHAPNVLSACKEAYDARSPFANGILLDRESFLKAPSIPLDIAIMEKSRRGIVVGPADIGWSDVGTWDAVKKIATEAGSNTLGPAQSVINQCKNVLIHASSRTVAAIGVEGLVIVETPDAVLVMRDGEGETVKNVTEMLAKKD